jgi:stage II sporulation protein P
MRKSYKYSFVFIWLRGGLFMLYKRRRTLDTADLKSGIIIYIILLILATFAISNFRAYMKNYNPNNLFYMQIVNYSMPLVKATAFEEEALSESEGTLSQQVLKIMGLNIYDPQKIMGKEMSFLKGLNFSEVEMDLPEITFSINPFNFNDNQVKKTNSSDAENGTKPTGSETSNTPSQSGTAVSVYNPSIKKTINKAKPEIFIYHTHTTEAYAPGDAYTQDLSKTVASVGDVLASELENNYGISVIHDKTIHDMTRNQAYSRSIVTLDRYLKQYGSFKMIIDLHRDSGPAKASTTAAFNNESLSKIMFVLAKKSPYYSKNEATVKKLEEISNKIFPGYSRSTFYKAEKNGYYNQHRQANTVLVEVGTELNTLDEGKNSAKYLARIIAEYLNGK